MTKAKNKADAATGESFAKASKGFDEMAAIGRLNLEAAIKSVNVAAKGMEEINGEFVAFSREAIEEGVAVTKAAMSAKSVQEAFEIQSGYAKSAIEAYVGRMTKFGDMFASVTRDAFEPINGRIQAIAEKIKMPYAA